ncbi:uroporphyrinogen-III C-methyltransferase [Shewanella sp. GXUN23E]|uniref:uroporphyrinogen-III C-methyltransferase n=1 Tax=Shewanella sp. GXUN23E TaxID=3422498 RepID=UPI003D7C5527
MDNKSPKSPDAEAIQADSAYVTALESASVSREQPQTSESVESPQSVTATRPSRRWGLGLLLILCILLTLLALAGSAFLYEQMSKQQAQFTEQLARQDLAMQQALKAPVSQLDTLAARQQQIDRSLAALKPLPEQYQQLNERLANLADKTPSHWQAAEANYLVTMAGRKLWLEKDPMTAAGLLEAADQRIAAMQDPALLPLRKALAKDIAAVKAIRQVDIAGTVFTLDEIINNLDKLPLNRAEMTASQAATDNSQLSDSLADWKSNLAKTWQALLDDFIVIRPRTTDKAPLLSPDQQWYLAENIRGKLLQAQLALYRGNEINYRTAISMARTWIFQYYDLASPEVESTLKALEAMETLKLSTISMNHFESSALLKQLIEQGELHNAAGESL